MARIRILASTNTAAVEMRVASYGHPLRRTTYGEFRGVYHVPLLPPLFRHAYRLRWEFVARNSAGDAERASVTVPIAP